MSQFPMTVEGERALREELDQLKTVDRPRIITAIAEARAHGDLKENAEYHAAREELSMIETRVQILQDRVARARVVDEQKISTDQASILTSVKVKDKKSGKEFNYILVSDDEANFKKGKISISSPVGKGLLGKKVGEIANIQVPAGILKYEILSISLPK